MKYKAEVQVINDVKWYSNALEFNTHQEAEDYAKDLFSRWSTTTAYRVVEHNQNDLEKRNQI